jgi:GNAT superfamily N-acetyltransferase
MRRRELAGRMQRAEGICVGSYLDASPRLARMAGTRTRRIDGVICLAAAAIDEPFLNRALGVGTIADATPRLLERIERHYASVERPARIAVATGFVTKTALRLLERRGYAPVDEEPQQICIYDAPRPPDAPEVAVLTIARVGPRDAALYSKTGYESFAERGPGFVHIVEALVRSRRRGLRAFLGRVDGEAAATGMTWDARPVVALGNGSVRPKFRGRGLQRALIAHRMRDAWTRGIRIYFGETVNPASAHNMAALGWRKLFDERDWERR